MSKLAAFNSACQLLGERKLGTLGENRPLANKLHTAWDNGAANVILSGTDWSFCRKTVELTYDPSTDALFGYEYAIQLPQDTLRHSGVYNDEMLHSVLDNYQYEDGYIHCSLEIIYFQYVPKITAIPESKWSAPFIDFLGAELAIRVSPDVDNGTKQELLQKEYKRRKLEAENADQMLNPSKRLPPGDWVSSRSYGRSRYTGRP